MNNNTSNDLQKAEVEVNIAKGGEREILNNLLSYHMHDLSEFVDDLSIDEKGFFQFDATGMYFEKEALIPLLFKVNGEYAGFILLNKPPYTLKDTDYCINEFFILKKYRRKGYASTAVEKLFKIYPGRYVVVQVLKNTGAISFWHSVYKKCNLNYIEKEIRYDGQDALSQEFTAGQ